MDDPGKYQIHAGITASGVIERSDVVGAVFGQTEGLLGEDLDLRSLQAADRVGRVEVDIESESGVSSGELQITTDMGRVETAVLAAALETIERIGPCRANVEIDRIEDVRAAKRRQVVNRAQELVVSGFEDIGLQGEDLVEAVRAATAPVDISDYAGYPAGPGVDTNEELIVVEGRADVARLLQFGITNVVGVEGTDVPDEIAALTEDRLVTAFFDGDRGGDLLLLELAQIGDVDYVTFAPPDRNVEDLSRAEIEEALAQQVPYDPTEDEQESEEPSPTNEAPAGEYVPQILQHVNEVIVDGSGQVRVLGTEHDAISTKPVSAYPNILDESKAIAAIILDGTIDQRVLDAASRHEIGLVIGRDLGEFTKRPREVHALTADRVRDRPEEVLPEQ